MKKLLCGAIALALLLANNGSCLGGGVNSASASGASRACEAASRIGAAADVITQGLLAAHIAQDKVAALVPLIQEGRLLVDASCAILVPPTAPTADAPTVTNAS